MLPLLLNAQNPTSVEAILASAQYDRGVNVKQQQLDFQRNKQSGLPFFNTVNFRSELNRMDLGRQEYLSRVKVNGLGEMRRFRGVQTAENEYLAAQKQAFFHEILYDRYARLANYRALQQETAIRQKLLAVYADKQKVLEQTAALGGETDLKDLLNTEFDRDEQTLRIRENVAALNELRVYFSTCLSGAKVAEPDTTGWIGPEKMALLLRETGGISPSHPFVLEKMVKIARIRADYALEKARSRQILDFFQVRYADRPEELFRAKMNVSIGFLLPYNGGLKTQQSKTLIEQNNAELDLQLYRERLQTALDGAKREFEALYEEYRLIQTQMRETQLRFAPLKTNASDKTGLEALLQLEELQLKRALRLRKIESDMAQRYLSGLFLNGRLSGEPLQNFLRTF